MSDISESLRTRVFHAAKYGMAITLYALLSDLPQTAVNELLKQVVEEEDGQKSTLLVIAAMHGHDKVVKMLLSRFSPNIEQEGVVKFDGYIIEGATALWCAAGAGHLKVVKTLVTAGADVNHPTKTHSTPLRAACFDGRLDIVHYLIEHNADIHIANKYNNTCLMVASYRGHGDVVDFLLQKGAKPNETAQCGATALHFASECGHLGIVKELLAHGAKFSLNESGMTPLTTAADRTREDVVQFLTMQSFVDLQDRIEAYELLGASFANDKDFYCPTSAFRNLKIAMDLRYSDPAEIIHKKLNSPVPAYDNWIESQSPEELENLAHDLNALHMESLAIRERILGPHNPEVPHPIIYRGAVFADHARFDRCIDLWLHALELRQLNCMSVVKDLLRFAQVFSQMVHVGVELHYSTVEKVMKAAIYEIEMNKSKIADPGPRDDVDGIQEEVENNLVTVLYLLVISTKLVAQCPKDSDKQSLHRIAFQANKLGVRTRDGETLLHLCVNSKTPLDDFHIHDVCKFPCAATALLLIQTGADVNAMDSRRNTPLHVIVSYQRPISDFMTLHTIIMELTVAGAHMDIVNYEGETPYDAATTGVAELILRTQAQLSLMCLAAKAVQTHKVPYIGLVPKSLESFIELHGPGRSHTHRLSAKDEVPTLESARM